MLDDQLKKTIQDNYSFFLDSKSMKPRYGQRLMIAEIARTLANIPINSDENLGNAADTGNKVCTIEAGTGTGKTLAYLISAIPIAKQLKKKLIISTATIALQEQIIFKDLPDILRHSNLEFSFTLAKGRKRYVCLSLLNRFLSSDDNSEQNALDFELIDIQPNKKVNKELYKKLHENLHKNKWNGERDDWPKLIEHSDWFPLTSDHSSCTGKRCAEYNQCIFYKARERVFKTDIIVANHDLVLSDLAMGGGMILPAPSDSIYIFDEGHHLPDKAIQHFSNNVQLLSTANWLQQLLNSLKKLESEITYPSYILKAIDKIPAMVTQCNEYSHELLQLLNDNLEFVERRGPRETTQVYRFQQGNFPNEFNNPVISLQQLFSSLSQLAEQIKNYFVEINEDSEEEHESSLKAAKHSGLKLLQASLSRIESTLILWQRYALPPHDTKKPPLAKWINKVSLSDENIKSPFDLNLHCSPVLPANELMHLIWEPCFASIITSATLATNGNFSLFQRYTGTSGPCSQIPSHFNYNELVEFYIPPFKNDPSQNSQEHTNEVTSFINDYIDREKGSLILFSSHKQLNDVEYLLFKKDKQWQDLILTQGKTNKQEIISQHKKRIDNNQGSVIFGLASFAEGVDLPGNYCECVVIAKLPFSVPDNPIDETLAEWLVAQGKNPFMEITVPQATIKLIQACGRLVRKETDSGKIVLLDTRIMTKRYGQMIFDALPNYQYKLNQYFN